MNKASRQEQNVQQFKQFWENNPTLINNLFANTFGNPQTSKLSEVPSDELLQFSKELFGFNREPYSSEEMREAIDDNLSESFKLFQQENPQEQLDLTTIMKLLEYCIRTNKTLSVEYNQSKPVSPKFEQQTTENEFQPEPVVQQQNQQQTEKTVKNSDEDAIARRLGVVFDFYCKQQQNVGANTTFDRISHECSAMNIGKFMIFSHGYGIINDILTKYVLMQKFKKIAEGHKQINLQKFVELMKILREIDPALISRVNLDSEINFKQKLRLLNIPFSSRTAVKHDFRPMIPTPKLTSHSGKTSEELLEYLQARRQEKQKVQRKPTPINSPPKIHRYQDRHEKDLDKPKYSYAKIASSLRGINTEQNESKNLKQLGLDQLIVQEENDDEWLKEYKLNTKNSEIMGRRQKETEVPRDGGSSRGHYENDNLKNKAIIQDLRKRITEISKSENTRDIINKAKIETKVEGIEARKVDKKYK